MDQKLLEALNNVGFALESLTEAIQSKQDSKSSTAEAIKSGNFGKQLESITVELKSIKADTQQILKNQETIISLSKEKEKTQTIEEAGSKEQQSAIKKGVGTILLIAGAVLAIGLAFKIVGQVDFLSVISLSLAITILAVAFEKVAQMKDLTLASAAIVSASLVMMSIALALSSLALSYIQPVSPGQILTGILIGGMFAVISFSIEKMMSAFEGRSLKEIGFSALFLPLILTSISIAIALSSYALAYVQPIGLAQFFTATLIAVTFVVISYGIRGLMRAFKGMDLKSVAMAAIFLPIILPAISLAIAGASYALQLVQPIGLAQFFSALMIGVIFMVLSFGLKQIIKAFKGIDPATAVVAAFMIPILFTAMSVAIWASSEVLSKVVPISFSQFLTSIAISFTFVIIAYALAPVIKMIDKMKWSSLIKLPLLFTVMSVAIMLSSHILSMMAEMSAQQMLQAAILGGVLSVIALIMTPVFKVMGKIGIGEILKGGLAIVVIAGVVMIASHILAIGDYSNYPGLDWIIGVGLSLTTFGIAAGVLGLMVFGPQALIFLAGLGAVLGVAGTIVGVSKILSAGQYDNDVYPGIGWIAGVALSLTAFGVAAFALGALVFGPQALIFLAGLGAVLGLAGTIVGVSKILSAGQYDNPGMLEWAKATSLLYATFTPIMLILGTAALASAVLSIFGPDPWKMAQTAIEDVSKTIVSSSIILSEGYTDKDGNKIKPNYKDGPTKKWAESVSIALGAFSPVYGMLMKNAIFSIFGGGGVGPDDFTGAIKTVSQGIVSAANFFASPENPGVWAGYPTKEWAEGVGLAIGAFAPVYEILAANSGWFSSGPEPEEFAGKFDDSGKLIKEGAIQVISRGIISAAKFFAENKLPFEEGNYPSKNWGEGVGAALSAFSPVFDMLMEKSGFWKSGDSVINDMIKGIGAVSTAIVKTAIKFTIASKKDIFNYYPNTDWSSNVRTAIERFVSLSNYLDENDAPYWKTKDVAGKIVSMAEILHDGSEFFSNSIDPNYISSVSKNMIDFNELVKKITDSESEGMLSRFSNNLLGTDPIIQIAKRMVTLAEGYDALANSLTKLGIAMKTLNITDVRMLGGLTRTLTAPTGDVSVGVNKDTESNFVDKKTTTSVNTTAAGTTFGNKIGADVSISDKLDEVIKLLSNIDKSTGSLDSLIGQYLGDEDAPKDVKSA